MTIEKMPSITRIGNDGVQGQTFSPPASTTPTLNADQQRDSIDIRHSLSRLSQLDASDIDNEKVERLQQSIAQGRYLIAAEVIADRLIAIVKDDAHV